MRRLDDSKLGVDTVVRCRLDNKLFGWRDVWVMSSPWQEVLVTGYLANRTFGRCHLGNKTIGRWWQPFGRWGCLAMPGRWWDVRATESMGDAILTTEGLDDEMNGQQYLRLIRRLDDSRLKRVKMSKLLANDFYLSKLFTHFSKVRWFVMKPLP